MIELDVKGMTCGHCVAAVTRAIRAVDPQARVDVDVAAGRVRVQGSSAPQALTRALGGAGYPAAPSAGAASEAPAKRCCCG
jgi:copper chaperone